MINLLKNAEELQDELIGHRLFLHQNAEVGLSLPVTSNYVFNALEAMGCNPKRIHESGIVVVLGKGTSGKTILIRADMDALHIAEQADIDFKCENGNMHACGHDMHTAMLLGATKLLKERENEIDGYVKLMFQPAEETMQGAAALIEAGILENPHVDAAMMIHVLAGFPAPTGSVLVANAGASMAGADWFDIKVQGKGAHGAMPQLGVDSLHVATQIYLALQEIISREIDVLDSCVLTVGYLRAGTINNVIPDSAELGGTVRTFSEKSRTLILSRIKDLSEGIAKAYRAEAQVEFSKSAPPLVNDEALVAFSNKYLCDLLGKDSVLSMNQIMLGGKGMGSEDFAFVSQKVPATSLMISAGDSREGYIFSQHHPKVKFDNSVLPIGAAVYAGFALEWLEQNS